MNVKSAEMPPENAVTFSRKADSSALNDDNYPSISGERVTISARFFSDWATFPPPFTLTHQH